MSKKADITWILIAFEKVKDGILNNINEDDDPSDGWAEIAEAAIDGARDATCDRIVELFREGPGIDEA